MAKNPIPNYRTLTESPLRDHEKAAKKHHKALAALEDGDRSEAERLLHDALLADVTFGPAHNTLGKIYFDQKKLYWAAWEFEYANEVMPRESRA